jgi:hypothetical protein
LPGIARKIVPVISGDSRYFPELSGSSQQSAGVYRGFPEAQESAANRLSRIEDLRRED